MAGTRTIFTRTMAAADEISLTGGEGISTISILCKTDNSGSNGITVLGTGGIGTISSNGIVLLADESLTISAPNGLDIQELTITAGASSTGIVTGA